ncbi:IPT/TIG domain-containing protein [Parapedobacter soli]|uniref:IPT/TIG domain-containing protein n=1 Tax=Parapedobacter soli TaxID=416955 RepID=UPI0021C7F892|nr:IPT/TIG domain-containing protein [Parapedobacter soli]
MKLTFPMRVVLACLASATLLTILSCEKKEVASTAVELLSFGPAGVNHGEQIRFIGNNLDKVTAIDLVGASIPSSGFVTHTSELIVVTVPIEAEYGPVTLKTAVGDIVSKSPLNLNVPVEITSFTETVKPGETITIEGEYLNWISAVTFEGGAVVETFESQSRTELVVRVPLEAQTGVLIFSCGGTEPISLESETALEVILPSPSSFTPSPVRHGSELTISGTDLDLVKGIHFTGLTDPVETFTSQTEETIVVPIPNGVNNGPFELIAFSGVTVASETSLQVVLPTVTALSPNPVAHGATLSISGTELKLVKGILFKGMQDTVTAFSSHTDTGMEIVVPEKAGKGTLTLVTHPLIDVETTITLEFVGDLPPLDPLPLPIYVDGIAPGWGDWGWGGSVDFNNADNVRDGAAAIKKVYDGNYGALRFHSDGVSTSSYTTVSFSIFGTEGTGGKTINVIANEQWGAPYVVTIVEGEWVTFNIHKSDLSFDGTLQDLLFQDTDWSGTIYVDHVGLR